MKNRKLPLLLILVSMLVSCGYSFQGSGSVLPPDVKKVYIPLVENTSTEPGLSNVMTEALQDRFERFGVLSIVDSTAEADAILKAKITDVKRETRTTTSNTDTALQYETQIVMDAELRRTSGPILWRNKNIQVSQSFGTTSDVIVTSSAAFAGSSLGSADLGALDERQIARGAQSEVLENLAEQAARRIYDDAVAPDF